MSFRLRPPAWLVRWVDADHHPEELRACAHSGPDTVDWARCIPFVILHLGCLGVIWTGWSPAAVAATVALYWIRMFGVTAGFHRYFSHRSYRTSRAFQFVLALLAGTTVQRGALWWAATHRHHHQHSDEEEDKHSPVAHGFWWSHIGWITCRRHFPTDYAAVPDLAKYPELVFLNRFDSLVPALYAAALYAAGALAEHHAPALGLTGPSLLVWGFFISTTALFHGTSCINSLSHLFGSRRFETGEHSRNNPWLAIITLGEGWHNNHHRYQATTKQGFYWWEFDPTYYGLKAMSWMGLIWGLKGVPDSVYEEAERTKAEAASQRA